MGSEQKPYPRNLPSDELICLPFLDTDTRADTEVANAELKARGYSARTVRWLRKVAGVGLWYQVVAWDWASLSMFDVMLGYVPMGLLLALLIAQLTFYKLALAILGLSLLMLVAAIAGAIFRRNRLLRRST